MILWQLVIPNSGIIIIITKKGLKLHKKYSVLQGSILCFAVMSFGCLKHHGLLIVKFCFKCVDV